MLTNSRPNPLLPKPLCWRIYDQKCGAIRKKKNYANMKGHKIHDYLYIVLELHVQTKYHNVIFF